MYLHPPGPTTPCLQNHSNSRAGFSWPLHALLQSPIHLFSAIPKRIAYSGEHFSRIFPPDLCVEVPQCKQIPFSLSPSGFRQMPWDAFIKRTASCPSYPFPSLSPDTLLFGDTFLLRQLLHPDGLLELLAVSFYQTHPKIPNSRLS